MRTNIEIDDKLMKKAMKASKSETKTKRAVVEEALELLVRIRAQEGLKDLFGKIEFWDGYDPKAMTKDKWAEAERRWQQEQNVDRAKAKVAA